MYSKFQYSMLSGASVASILKARTTPIFVSSKGGIDVILHRYESCSSASIVTKLRSGRQDLDSRQGQKYFLSATASRSALGPSQSPLNGYWGLFLCDKVTGA
jgi:hypothetical protein